MNKIDRSSDNWYPGMDSEDLSQSPDFESFDEDLHPLAIKKYSTADLLKLLWIIFSLKSDEFRIVRYRMHHPEAPLQEIANHEGEVKASTFKKIRKICENHPVFCKMFSSYKIEK